MAIKNIVVAEYAVPGGVDVDSVLTTALAFNQMISDLAAKYIGQEKMCNRTLLKKIPGGNNITYTIRFAIKKTSTLANVEYEFMAPGSVIISSNQGYKTFASFTTDMEFINDTIKNIFSVE